MNALLLVDTKALLGQMLKDPLLNASIHNLIDTCPYSCIIAGFECIEEGLLSGSSCHLQAILRSFVLKGSPAT